MAERTAKDTDSVGAALEGWSGPEPSDAFPDRVMAALDEREPKTPRRWGPTVALAAVLTIGGVAAGYALAGADETSTEELRIEADEPRMLTINGRGRVALDADSVLHWRADGERDLLWLRSGSALIECDGAGLQLRTSDGKETLAAGTCYRIEARRALFANEETVDVVPCPKRESP